MNADFLRGGIVLGLPRERVVVPYMTEVKKAARGHQEIQRRLEWSMQRDWKKGSFVGPASLLINRRNQCEPASEAVVSKPARAVLHVWLKMKNGIAEFVVAGAREVRQPLDDYTRLARYQLWNHGAVEAVENPFITGQIAAIQQRNRELHISRVESLAFGESARRGAELQFQIPYFLRKISNGIFERLIRLAGGVQKKNVHIGVRKEPAPAESAQRHKRKIGRPVQLGRDQLLPQPERNGFNESGARQDGCAAIAIFRKIILDTCRFGRIKIAEFAAQ